jgi:hypothetical protein
MLNFFNAGMIVAQGTLEEVKKDIPELEVYENKESTAETEEESENAERDIDLAEAEQLREAEEHREVGSVSFNVDAKYFMFGAPALMLLLILLIIAAGQGKINSTIIIIMNNLLFILRKYPYVYDDMNIQ